MLLYCYFVILFYRCPCYILKSILHVDRSCLCSAEGLKVIHRVLHLFAHSSKYFSLHHLVEILLNILIFWNFCFFCCLWMFQWFKVLRMVLKDILQDMSIFVLSFMSEKLGQFRTILPMLDFELVFSSIFEEGISFDILTLIQNIWLRFNSW